MAEEKGRKLKIILSVLALCVIIFACYIYYGIENGRSTTVREEQEIR